MELQAIWSNEFGMNITKEDDEYFILEELLEMLNFYEKFYYKYFCSEDEFYNEEFCDWLYDKKNIELVDLKRELQKKLQKCEGIDTDEYSEKMKHCVNGKLENRNFYIDLNESQLLCAYTKKKFFNIKRIYLNQFSKSEFKDNLRECFENIFFDEGISTTINTLQNDFSLIKSEIIMHLSKLDDYYSEFVKQRNCGCSNREIAEHFHEYSKIACSPQAGRDGVKKLERIFFNSDTRRNEKICCELHTKFDNRGKDHEKKDRIYFSVGRDGIQGGKIIVIHIGKHL